jgi:hypothetical protein
MGPLAALMNALDKVQRPVLEVKYNSTTHYTPLLPRPLRMGHPESLSILPLIMTRHDAC